MSYKVFKICTICGSMKFYPAMLDAAQRLSKEGIIVLMPFVTFTGEEEQSSEQKAMLDEMHFVKIAMSEEICVVTNTDGYTGLSTQKEMTHALMNRKGIRVMEYKETPSGWEYVGVLKSGW